MSLLYIEYQLVHNGATLEKYANSRQEISLFSIVRLVSLYNNRYIGLSDLLLPIHDGYLLWHGYNSMAARVLFAD